MPKVSVIIPAYNAMTFLPLTLQSVLEQTWQNYEVIIVNDGSQDNLLDWSQTILDPRVKVITQANKGLAGARNTGVHNAIGDYLAFLDADDLWEPTKIEKQVRVLDENPNVGLVYTWVASINEQGKKTGRIFKHQARGRVWKSLVTYNLVECGSNPLVRKECFETCGTFDQNLRSFVEDWDMWLRIARNYEFDFVPEPLILYRQHSASASQNWQAMEVSFQQVIAKAFDSPPDELYSLKGQALAFAYMCLAWKPLQSKTKDASQALAFQKQARQHYPPFRNSKEDLRLSFAIFLMQFLGPKTYQQALSFGRTVRQQLMSLT